MQLTGAMVPTAARFAQPLYAVMKLWLERRFASSLEVALNINNLAHARYFASTAALVLGNYYGEPRSILLSLQVLIH